MIGSDESFLALADMVPMRGHRRWRGKVGLADQENVEIAAMDPIV